MRAAEPLGNFVVDQRSDEQLVADANAGERAAFEALYRRHRDWAHRLATRFSASDADAQDAVQEVFIWLARKFPGFALRAKMTTVLYPAVKHAALAIRRKRRRGGSEDFPADLADEGAELPKDGDLRTLLGKLSEAHREVVLMRFVDDMTLEEIAAGLGVPTGTVKSRLHHALAALKEDPGIHRYFAP